MNHSPLPLEIGREENELISLDNLGSFREAFVRVGNWWTQKGLSIRDVPEFVQKGLRGQLL